MSVLPIFRENFNSTTLDLTKWVPFQSTAARITFSGGKLVLTGGGSGSPTAYIQSVYSKYCPGWTFVTTANCPNTNLSGHVIGFVNASNRYIGFYNSWDGPAFIQCIIMNPAGVATKFTTTVAADNTQHALKIKWRVDGYAEFYIDGVLVYTSTFALRDEDMKLQFGNVYDSGMTMSIDQVDVIPAPTPWIENFNGNTKLNVIDLMYWSTPTFPNQWAAANGLLTLTGLSGSGPRTSVNYRVPLINPGMSIKFKAKFTSTAGSYYSIGFSGPTNQYAFLYRWENNGILKTQAGILQENIGTGYGSVERTYEIIYDLDGRVTFWLDGVLVRTVFGVTERNMYVLGGLYCWDSSTSHIFNSIEINDPNNINISVFDRVKVQETPTGLTVGTVSKWQGYNFEYTKISESITVVTNLVVSVFERIEIRDLNPGIQIGTGAGARWSEMVQDRSNISESITIAIIAPILYVSRIESMFIREGTSNGLVVSNPMLVVSGAHDDLNISEFAEAKPLYVREAFKSERIEIRETVKAETMHGPIVHDDLNISENITVEVMVGVVEIVLSGGGGGGGGNMGGGGGAGGYVYQAAFGVGYKTYSFTLGTGGPGGLGGASGTKGVDSIFSSLTATGGGYGGYYNNVAGGPGGSGGGGGGGTGVSLGGAGSQGFKGGDNTPNFKAGAGGGAGAVGTNGTTPGLVYGGAGVVNPIQASLIGQNVAGTYWICGGAGAGGYYGNGSATNAGGNGGGGAGTTASAGNGVNGTANTGGGGGGAGYKGGRGGTGGSGFAIVKWVTADYEVCSVTGVGNTIITDGANSIAVMIVSGNWICAAPLTTTLDVSIFDTINISEVVTTPNLVLGGINKYDSVNISEDITVSLVGPISPAIDVYDDLNIYSSVEDNFIIDSHARGYNFQAQAFGGFSGAQSFKGSNDFILKSIVIDIVPAGGLVAGTAYIKVYAHSGTFGTSSIPTGAPLSTSDGILYSSLSTGWQTFTFSGANQITLVGGTPYVFDFSFPDGSSHIFYRGRNPGTAEGNYSSGNAGTWTPNATMDLRFYAYGDTNFIIENLGDISVYESAQISETQAITNSDLGGISRYDSINISESKTVSPLSLVDISKYDSVNISESTTVPPLSTVGINKYDSLNISELITITPPPLVGINLLDSINISEATTVTPLTLTNLSKIDSLNISESVSLSNSTLGSINVVDNINISENFTDTGLSSLSVFDSLNITDVATVGIPLPILPYLISVFDIVNIPSVVSSAALLEYYDVVPNSTLFGMQFLGESFISPTDTTLDSAKFYLKKEPGSTGVVNAILYSTVWNGSNFEPTSVLATSDNVDLSGISEVNEWVTFTFSGAERISLVSGTTYTLMCLGTPTSGFVYINCDMGSPTYTDIGWTEMGGTWIPLTAGGLGADVDILFYVYGAGVPDLSFFNVTEEYLGDISKIENINITDINTVGTPLPLPPQLINVYDTVNISESVTITIPLPSGINVYDTLNISEAVNVSPLVLSDISKYDTINISESITITPLSLSDINKYDSVNISELITLSPLGLTGISVFDSVNITEAVIVTPLVLVGINRFDSINISESVSITLPITDINVSDSINISENFTDSGQLFISVNDLINISENFVDTGFTNINVYDLVNISENVSNIGESPISIYDSISISESISTQLTVDINTYDSLNISESINTSGQLVLSIFDSVNISEITNNSGQIGNISISDSISISELVTVTNDQLGGINVSDSVNTSENFYDTGELSLSKIDSISISEFVTVANNQLGDISVFDIVNISENFTNTGELLVSIIDTINITESITNTGQISISVAELVNISEFTYGVTQLVDINIVDNINISENFTNEGRYTISVADTISLSELVTVTNDQLGGINVEDELWMYEYVSTGNNFIAIIFEQISISDEATLSNPPLGDISVIDAVSVLDNLSPDLQFGTINLVDVINISEYVLGDGSQLGQISPTDNISISESINLSNSQLGDISVFEQINISENFTDTGELNLSTFDLINVSENFTDSGSISLNVNDQINITDNVSLNLSLGGVSVVDNVNITENLQIQGINLFDLIYISEVVTLENGRLGDISVIDYVNITELVVVIIPNLGDIQCIDAVTISEVLSISCLLGGVNVVDSIFTTEDIQNAGQLGNISVFDGILITEDVRYGFYYDIIVSDQINITELNGSESFRFSPSDIRPVGKSRNMRPIDGQLAGFF